MDLEQLADALADFTFAYLVTVDDGHRAHAVAVDPVLANGVIDVGTVGASTRRNLEQHDGVMLVWPPRERGGYTLIVDGRGEPTDTTLQVVPDRAVLHRRAAPGAVTKPGCKDDCLRLEEA